MNYHWPPDSWGGLTIPMLVRLIGVEQKMNEDRDRRREPTGPPMRPDTGSDTADDDEE